MYCFNLQSGLYYHHSFYKLTISFLCDWWSIISGKEEKILGSQTRNTKDPVVGNYLQFLYISALSQFSFLDQDQERNSREKDNICFPECNLVTNDGMCDG